MDKEKNIKNAITLLDAILNNWKKRNNNQKEYCIFFPKFSTEENKLTALFPIFEKYDDSTLELAAWGEYDLETYTLSQYIAEEKEIIIKDKEIANYKDNKFEDLLEAFVKVFYMAQSFKKFEVDSAEYKQNKKNLINGIYDYEDIFINDVTDELNDVYGIEYEEEDVEETKEPEEEIEEVVENIEEIDNEDEFASLLVDDEDELEPEEEIEEVVENIEEIDDEDEFASLLVDDEDELEPEEEIEEVVEDVEEIDDEDEFASLLVDEEDELEPEEEIEEVVEDVEEIDDEDEFASLLVDDEDELEPEEEIEEVVENIEEIDDEDEFASLLVDDEDELEPEEEIEEVVEVVEEVDDEDEFASLLVDDEDELEPEEEIEEVVEDVEKIDDEDEFASLLVDDEDELEPEEEIEEVVDDVEKIDDEDEFASLLVDDEDELEPEEEIEEVVDDKDKIEPEEIEEVIDDVEEIEEDKKEDEVEDKLEPKDIIVEDKSNDIEFLKQQLLEKEKKYIKEKEEKEKKEYKLEEFDPYILPEGSENTKYEFSWELENGLKYISDKSLKIAYSLIEKGNFSLKIRPNNDSEQVVITSNTVSLCGNAYTTDELLYGLEQKEPKIREEKLFKDGKNDYTVMKDLSLERVCYKCDFEKCPKHVAGYILYLRNTEKLVEKLKEREEFRKNNPNINDKYAYVWEVEDGLKKVPQKIFEFAEELVDRKCTHVVNYLNKSGLIQIFTPMKCSEYKLLETEKENLNYNREFSEWKWIVRNPVYRIRLCNDYGCRLDACPIVVAGYIHYLKRIGREDLIIADRKYYLENKEKIDLENEEIKADKITEIENKKNDYLESLKREYEGKIYNLKDFTDTILNPSQTNLHCTLEGKDKIGKNRFISEISNILNKVDKTDTTYPYRISLQNFAASNAYSYTFKGNTTNRDINGIFYQTERAMKYTELMERKLYVIDGINEFIEDYKRYKADGTNEYLEIRKRQFEHTFDLLTKMNLKNYIILDGTEKEIEELLEIEPRLQFVYKNYRFKIPDPSMDEIYNLYMQSLKPDLLVEIRANNEEYKKQFIEYISLNKNFIPLSDRELANYLAVYSNSKNKIVFPENIYKKETIEESLKNIIGLENVKNKVAEFEKYMLFQMKAKTVGLNLNSTNMHMIFTGNPGTGKTTIARIMAKMLFDLGIIKENKLIEVERKDLIANYIGQTATKTAEVISKAMGGVLFIDEAYELAGKGERDFGLEAIATLIKAMEDHKDEFVVIFAGYKNEMKTFIDSNPGIASRIGYTFDFPDYTPEELIEIFNKKMGNMGFEVDKSVEIKLNSICKYFSKRKAFGNGRFVDKLIQEVIMKHSKRETDDIKLITKEDMPEIEDLNNNNNSDDSKDTKELLNDIVGMDKLKEKILEFEEYVSFLKEAENNKLNIPNQNMHMVFTGNPGTGKTTIARIMAKMLRDLGMIHENKLIEVERKDLIAEYVGQTAIKTSQVIDRAMGGVLFIDEAYTLVSPYKNDFGHEAIATLIKAMEDHKGEFVVIFAGYKEEMKDFIDMNPGIASRIGYTFDFPNYTDIELSEILYRKIKRAGMSISNDSKESVEKVMKYFCNVENIGNGRFVDKVLQEILMKHAKNKKRKIGKIQKEDIPSIKEMTDVIFSGSSMIDVDRITDEDLKKTAVHEVGHACIRLLLFKEPGIKKITINAEGTGALGYVRHSASGSYTASKTTLLNNIKVLLAGMVAEQVYFGEFENGNTSDLENASGIAKNMITKYGMSDLGFGQISNPDGVLAQSIQNEINKMLKQCFDETVELVKNNKKKMDKVVDYLLKNKEIDEEELIKNFK